VVFLASACCLRQISGTDLYDGGETDLSDAGPDAGVGAGVDAGFDAGPCASLDAWSRPRLACVAARDAGACQPGPASNLNDFGTYSPTLWMGDIASADMNGDGLLDLVAARFPHAEDGGYGLGLDVFLARSDGGLSPPVHYPGTFGFSLAVGDLDDAGPGVVVANGGELDVFANDGSGGLTPVGALEVSQYFGIDQIAIVDLNQDGLADIVFSGGIAPALSGSIDVFWGQPCGGFAGPSVVAAAGGNASIAFAVGDLNGDCLPDLVANTTDYSQLMVMLNEGDGGFQTSLYPTPALGGVTLLPTADGIPDLVVGVTGYPFDNQLVDDGLQLLWNRGDGTFATGPDHRVGGYGTIVGDFNGDCIPDLVTSFGTDCSGGSWQATVLLGDGDGGFGDSTTLNGAGLASGRFALLGPVREPRALAVGDSCGHGLRVFGDASSH